jgi:hypothetical protein
MLDTRPPPSLWCLNPSDRLPAVRRKKSLLAPISIAIDEPNDFVYVASCDPQTVTQYKATVKTADAKTSDGDGDEAGSSTVSLKLTAVRELEGVQYPPTKWGQLTAIAVLSPSTLLLSHYERTLHALTHAVPTDGADSKLAGPVGVLQALDPLRKNSPFATGIAVDTERRLVFAGESSVGRVVVFDADSGLRITEVQREQMGWGSAADVAVIDGVLVTADYATKCLHFMAVDAIPGLK